MIVRSDLITTRDKSDNTQHLGWTTQEIYFS